MENERASTKILIIEDDPTERVSLQAALEAALPDNAYIESAESGSAAEALVKVQFFDVVIVDYRLPDTDGLALIKKLKTLSPDITPIVVTGYSSIELAVDSMRIGAYDYIVKPIKIDLLVKSIQSLVVDKETLLDGKKKLLAMVNDNFKYTADKDDELTVILTPNTDVLVDKEKSFLSDLKKIFVAIRKYYWS